jgi:hypothetical protein|tara:strand:+ start:872 stop:2293 length:1422 start_codon:yes stop_codon:yes gene_type:complete
MCDMPRLSIYKPEKGNDYKFFDRNIKEQFTVGGTDIYLHKYLGTNNPTDNDATADKPQHDVLSETNIEDLLFLENRNRKYSEDVYIIRGIYNVQDLDFNLSQFGMFLQNDTVFMTVHLNDIVERIGRKPMSGDVIELPHMKDDFALDTTIPIALKRFYVVEDVNRAAEGFSATWWPHLLRLKLKNIVDSQEYKEILDKTVEGTDNKLSKYMSTYEAEMKINSAVVAQAEADAPKSGFNYKQYYVSPVDERGNIRTDNVNSSESINNIDKTTNAVIDTPASGYYGFYYNGDGVPPNGFEVTSSIKFPTENVAKGNYCLRVDYLPNRLFRFDGTRWVKVEDNVRMSSTNNGARNTFKTAFANSVNYVYNKHVGSDFVKLIKDDVVINTNIDYISSLYIVLRYEGLEVPYSTATYTSMISSYLDSTNTAKVRITLPTINTVQETIPYSGLWSVNLYNNRIKQNQSLTGVLTPQADN